MCPWLLGMRGASLPLLPDSSGPGDLTGDARVVQGEGRSSADRFEDHEDAS